MKKKYMNMKGRFYFFILTHYKRDCMLFIEQWNGKMNLNFIIFWVYILNYVTKKKDLCILTFYKTKIDKFIDAYSKSSMQCVFQK